MTTTPTPVGIMCAWCRNRFEWTPGPDRTRPLYCSKYHNNLAQAHAKAKREGATPGVCPFPWKARYADNNAARAVIDANPVTKAGNRPYLCPGGEHHHIGRLTAPAPPPRLVVLPPPPPPRLPPGARPGPPPSRRPPDSPVTCAPLASA